VLLAVQIIVAAEYCARHLGAEAVPPVDVIVTPAAAYATASGNLMTCGNIAAANGTASAFGTAVIDILDYANTNKYKTVRTLAGWDANGSGLVSFWSGSWRNTNATTTITLLPNLGNWAQYSQFALYGVN